jgi:hypothetical protein
MKPGVGFADARPRQLVPRPSPGTSASERAKPVPRRKGSERYHHPAMAEMTQTVEERLEEIGTQLAWVRDYL